MSSKVYMLSLVSEKKISSAMGSKILKMLLCSSAPAICLKVKKCMHCVRSWKRLGKPHDIRLAYGVSIFITVGNLASLNLAEIPRLYTAWTSNFALFGIPICQFLWVVTPACEVLQTNLLAILIIGIWIRQRQLYSLPGTKILLFSTLVPYMGGRFFSGGPGGGGGGPIVAPHFYKKIF
jgi:hypothetical protein